MPDYPFAPNYIEGLDGFETLRMHYLDEGSKMANTTFLCLHGQPSWSFLYRKMIPVFAGAGYRVIAPDLFGFGKSDKPVDDDVYTYHFHRDALMAFIRALDLQNVTLVCQDWGGILGLTLVPEMRERFTRLIVMNTAIPTGISAGKGFEDWKAYNRSQPDLNVAGLFKRSHPRLSEAEAAAYAAPFPDVSYKAGVRRFPELVMVEPDMEGVNEAKAAVKFWQEDWAGESFMAIGMQDPVLGPPIMYQLRNLIKGCPEPMIVENGGHFVQECGTDIAKAALTHFGLG